MYFSQEYLTLLLDLLLLCDRSVIEYKLGGRQGGQNALRIGQPENSLVIESSLYALDGVQVLLLDERRGFQGDVLAFQLIDHVRQEGVFFDLLQRESATGLPLEQSIAQVSGQGGELIGVDQLIGEYVGL